MQREHPSSSLRSRSAMAPRAPRPRPGSGRGRRRSRCSPTGPRPQARQAAEQVERLPPRAAVGAVAPLALRDAPPPLVFAFARRAVLLAGAFPCADGEPQEVDGVILGGADRTYIAVNLAREDRRPRWPTSTRTSRSTPSSPRSRPWLGEGLAELLAARQRVAGVGDPRPRVGRAPPADRAAARRCRCARCSTVGYLSPTYQGDRGPAGPARRCSTRSRGPLVHWIVAGGHGGMPGGDRLSRARSPTARILPPAFARCFGMTVDAAEASLAAYLAGPAPAHRPVPLPPAAAAAPVEVVGRGRGRGGRASRRTC